MTDPRKRTIMPSDPEQEPYVALRTKALESLLIEKGLLTAEAVDELISTTSRTSGHSTAPGRRARLDRSRVQAAAAGDGAAAVAEFGIPGSSHLVVVENTPERAQHGRLHALLVLPVVGARATADLVQGFAYRSRAVIEPRASCASLDWNSTTRSRSTSGTAAPSSATWCCRNARPARRT